MHAAHAQLDIRALQASWQAFDTLAHLRPIHNERGVRAHGRTDEFAIGRGGG